MKVKNLVFSGAMASILMMGAAVAEAPVKAVDVWNSTDGGVVLNNLMSSLDAKKADQSTIADGLLADKTIDTTGEKYTTTVDEKTITAGTEYAVGDDGYKLAGVTGGCDIDYSTPDVATQGFLIASSKDTQYATVNATLKSSGENGEYEINYGDGLTYTTGEVSGTDIDVYTLTYTTADDEPVFAKKHNAEAAETLTIADLVDGSEEKAAYEKLKDNYDRNKTKLGELAGSLKDQYDSMSTTVGEHNSIATALQEYQDASSNYEGTLAQIVDSSYGDKLSQTLGYDVALTDAKTKLAEAGFESTDFLGAVTENKDAIAQVRSDAGEAYEHAHNWAEYVMGVDVDEDREGQLQNALSNLASEDKIQNIGSDNIAGALHELDVEKVNTSDVLSYDDGKALWNAPSTASDTKVMSSGAVKAVIEGVYDDANEFLTKELGYDTKTTDAKTELKNTTLFAEDVDNFLDAVVANKKDINTNTKAIATEAETRHNEDVAILKLVMDESNARQAEEQKLSLAISGEAAERAAEDAKLRSAIDATRNDIAALDSKVNDLDENLSAGIASSVALSAVEVSNVKKGEMSVGGGYGNYNSKSAMAFGAALGITDNWSANAGVGLGFGKDTKASFRVGTNYKFKLF